MKMGVVIQARMGSKRYPGKVLHMICGKPLLKYLIESLQRCQLADEVVVATSLEMADDAIVRFCRACDVECHRGDTNHVANRIASVLQKKQWGGLARVCGDSPLLDHRLVDRALEVAIRSGDDIITNVFPRTFPRGQSVEVIRADALRRGLADMTSPDDWEHVTPVFYRRPSEYSINNLRADTLLGHVHLAVDTPHDMQNVRSVVKALSKPHWTYDVYELASLWESITRQPSKLSA